MTSVWKFIFVLCKFQTNKQTNTTSKKNQVPSAQWTRRASHLWCNEVLCVINYNGAEKAYDFLADCLLFSSVEPKLRRNYTCGCELRLIGHWIVCAVSFPPEKPLKLANGSRSESQMEWDHVADVSARPFGPTHWHRQSCLQGINGKWVNKCECEGEKKKRHCLMRMPSNRCRTNFKHVKLEITTQTLPGNMDVCLRPIQKGIGDLESKYRVSNEAC